MKISYSPSFWDFSPLWRCSLEGRIMGLINKAGKPGTKGRGKTVEKYFIQ
jgi:hypothetical protein